MHSESLKLPIALETQEAENQRTGNRAFMIANLYTVAAAAGSAVISAANWILLADAASADERYALKWTLLPMIGAVFACIAALFLNPQTERRRTVFGRTIVGMICGITVPKVASICSQTLKDVWLEPLVVILAAFLITVLAYALSRPIVEKVFRQSSSMADNLIDEARDRMHLPKGPKHNDRRR